MSKHLFLSNQCMLDHVCPRHPEAPSRLRAIIEEMALSPHKKYLDMYCERLATTHDLCRVHTSEYVDQILALEGQEGMLDRDTFLSAGSIKAALTAAGLGIELVEQVLSGKIHNGFLFERPPGHHARPGVGMGFCIFNNIAIAAKKALSLGIERILIFDWDVHHGNGTQEAFYEDDRVLFIDFHQENLFPLNSGLINEIGSGEGLGYTRNVPLPAMCGNDDYFYAFDELVVPLAKAYRPQLILVSAGFDAHAADPLGSMRITSNGFGILAAKIKTLAEQLCEGKLILFLEGGYDPYYLAQSVMECVGVLVNESPASIKAEGPPSIEVKRRVDEVKEVYDRK